ncbi:autotransporter-associated beta strand repeat-containing protein [Akkermansiaceae bacterium]|nr:autotransporter-associated beta strand repeat-containing protein [Akkermansiaceae bacterium]MDB4545639.1 autotransporter-associated beta strand repeat-containing protein [Akkermansiaceae bacterium]
MKKSSSPTILVALSLSALPAAAQSLSVNFGSDRSSSSVSEASKLTGAVGIAGNFWNNTTVNGSGTLSSLIDSSGATTTGAVTWTTANTWQSGSTGATATSENGDLTKGYLDDGTDWTVDFTSPFLLNDIYVIHGTDQGNPATMSAISVNGAYYKGDGSSTVLATGTGDSWSAANWSNSDTLTESNNYLRINNLGSIDLSVADSSPGRGAIAGLQVVNTYTGTMSHWDIDDATAGSGGATPSGTWDGATTNWSSSVDGDVATGAWTAGNGAVFSAGTDATGSYAITVSGAQSASALWFKDGAATVSGDGITLTDQAIVRTDNDSIISSVISGSDGLFKVGSGTLTLGAVNTYTGPTVINEGTVTLGAINYVQPINPASEITINHGATLNVASGINSIQRNTGHAAIIVDGGTLDYTAPTHGHMGNITLKNGGTWSASSGGGYNGENMMLNGTVTVEGTSASNINNFSQGLALNGNRTFDVADVTGDAAADLIVAAELENNDGGAGDGFTKTGAGTMVLNTFGSYSGATNVTDGLLQVNATLRGTSSMTASNGGTIELGAINIFVGGHGTELPASRVLTANAGSIVMNTAFDGRFGNVTLSNGGTLTSNRALTAWDGLMGQTTGGVAAVLTVDGTGAATMDGTGGIHLNHVATFDVADTTGDAGSDLVVSMTLADGGNVGGTGGINKTGVGTMEINGSQTYSGATNVTEGELSVLGALGLTDVVVSADAVISGTGTIGGTLNVADAGKLDVSDGILTVTGAVTFNDFGFDDLIGFDPEMEANGSYTLINGANVDLTNVQNAGLVNALTLTDGRQAYFFEGSLGVMIVPEPGSAMLVLLGSLAGLIRRHR